MGTKRLYCEFPYDVNDVKKQPSMNVQNIAWEFGWQYGFELMIYGVIFKLMLWLTLWKNQKYRLEVYT